MKKYILLAILAGLIFVPAVTFAQAPPQLLPDCDPIPGRTASCGFEHLIKLAINIYDWLLYFAAFVALLMIVWSGVRMLWFSYFENSEAELGDAKKTFTRAITGLVIIVAAYLIVNTLVLFLTGNTKGLNDFLNFQK